MADPQFTMDPGALGSAVAPFDATTINGVSSALVQQTGATTQTETGFVKVTSFTNTETIGPIDPFDSGLLDYNLYITFTATVTGLAGFAPGTSGTIGAGDFNFIVYADPLRDDTFGNASVSATGGSPPVITDPALDDVVLAFGTSINGSAGFAAVTGAPFLSVLTSFTVCDGTAIGPCNTGPGGAFDATDFFTAPDPFFDLALTSTISGSISPPTNIGPPPNAALNGLGTATTFLVSEVPEPGSLALLGAALIGFFAIARRRWPKAQF
jgi:hypothetical protein